jgi:hypothetical protein
VAEGGDGRKREDVQRRRGRPGVQGSRWMMPSRDHLGYHQRRQAVSSVTCLCHAVAIIRVKHTFVCDEMHMSLEQRNERLRLSSRLAECIARTREFGLTVINCRSAV